MTIDAHCRHYAKLAATGKREKRKAKRKSKRRDERERNEERAFSVNLKDKRDNMTSMH